MKRITLTQWLLLSLYIATLILCAGIIFCDDHSISNTVYFTRTTVCIICACGLTALYSRLGIFRRIAANIDEV